MELKYAEHRVLSVGGTDNDDVNADNIIFSTKDTKLYILVVTLSAKENQKLSKLLSKWIERLVYWNECKAKCENKNMKNNNCKYFFKSNFVGVNRLFVLIQLDEDDS